MGGRELGEEGGDGGITPLHLEGSTQQLGRSQTGCCYRCEEWAAENGGGGGNTYI